MKSTGIVRKIGELGRIVIPKEIRRTMYIANGDPLEIFIDEERIILSKYEPCCTFCGSSDGAVDFKGRIICRSCREELKAL